MILLRDEDRATLYPIPHCKNQSVADFFLPLDISGANGIQTFGLQTKE